MKKCKKRKNAKNAIQHLYYFIILWTFALVDLGYFINSIQGKNIQSCPKNVCIYMGKILEDGKDVQSLAVIVLDVFLYNF